MPADRSASAQADSWAHLVHPEDAGTAVAAALHAPGGVYNVGADPVRRGAMLGVFGEVVDRDSVGFLPRLVVKMAGERLEPLTRSHRISSAKLHEVTGWKPHTRCSSRMGGVGGAMTPDTSDPADRPAEAPAGPPDLPDAGPAASGGARRRERERRRLAEIFGDVLPESTRDDQDEAADDGTDAPGRGPPARRPAAPHLSHLRAAGRVRRGCRGP